MATSEEETIPTKWGLLRIVSEDEATVLIDGKTNSLLKVFHPEDIHEAVTSPNGECILLRTMQTARNDAYTYSRLICLQGRKPGHWSVETVLKQGTPPMDTRRRWVCELGTVSNSGTKALLKIGEADSSTVPYRMRYRWQTLPLTDGKVIGHGVRVPANFDD